MALFRALGLAIASMLAAVSVALAASANVASLGLAMVALEVPRCTTAGLTVVPNLSGANVVSVAVGAIPAACGTSTLHVTVAAGAASGSGSATVPAAGGSVTVSLATAVAAAASARIDLLMTGP